MAPDDLKLVVLPFLQNWDGDKISLRVLLVPRDAFIEPWVRQTPPPPAFFAAATLKFDVHFLPGFEHLPSPDDGTIVGSVTFEPIPSAIRVFVGLKDQFDIDQSPPRARDPSDTSPITVRKHLPISYQNTSGFVPGESDLFTTDHTYSCSLKMKRPKPYKRLNSPPQKLNPSWAKLIASILRTPKFAESAGLVRTCSISVPQALIKDGGFLFLTLAPATAIAIGATLPKVFKSYATRVPELATPRDLFTPVLFPLTVSSASTGAAGHGEIFAEVDEYVDGWAKAVHCMQSQQLDSMKEEPDGTRPIKDLGIRLGWDDEQVTKWLDRQMDPTSSFDCPLGVHGYRIDVKMTGSNVWSPLTRGTGPFGVNNAVLGTFEDDLAVEIHPVQHIDTEEDRLFWLPMYFANWTGGSLVGLDEGALTTSGKTDVSTKSGIKGVAPRVDLRYGSGFDFRVRLMDHTGGGPTLTSSTSNIGPSPVSHIGFRRWIRPLAPLFDGQIPSISNDPGSESAPLEIKLKRPPLSWPAVAFTGAYTDQNPLDMLRAKLKADRAAASDPQMIPEPTLPDPDVDRVEITVLVQTLAQDPSVEDGTYTRLYQTTRRMPVDRFASLVTGFTWRDCPDIWNPQLPWNADATDGPLILPKARTIRLRIGALCREEPETDPSKFYFGAVDVRRGPQIVVPLRKNSGDERGLFTKNTQSDTISAFFLQPGGLTTPAPQLAQAVTVKSSQLPVTATARLASEIHLRSVDAVLRSPPGKRVVFACSGGIRHVIGPDRASVSFTSEADLIQQWVVVIRLTIERDWTWDGLKDGGISVKRGDLGGQDLLTFSPNQNISVDALSGAQPDRSHTDLVIIDVINPKSAQGANPQQIDLTYSVNTSFLGPATLPSDQLPEMKLRLPVTTPPIQIPKIVSAGIAMSPYDADPFYASTAMRQKMLWIELAEPLQDPDDKYFARILRSAPDPLLVGSEFLISETVEADLAIDPEPLRRIVPDQADDRSGLDAMQPLIASTSPLHWGLPLPPGLDEDSPQLLGFFTYELRVGHYNDGTHARWSTAQGRFGGALRVAGVQHPFPQLKCTAVRAAQGIIASAPYALAALDDMVNLRHPTTRICIMLYAQAAQIDGGDQKRNILLMQKMDNQFSTTEGNRYSSVTFFFSNEVNPRLDALGFTRKTPLSVLAVEMFDQKDQAGDPMGANLGRQQIFRTSNLTAVASAC